MNANNRSRSLVIAAGILASLTTAPANAESSWIQVAPTKLETLGFTFKARMRKDGLIAVRITIDPAKVKDDESSLVVSSHSRTFRQRILPKEQEGKLKLHRFDITPENFRRARVLISKNFTPGDRYWCGGPTYCFRLADFQGRVSCRQLAQSGRQPVRIAAPPAPHR